MPDSFGRKLHHRELSEHVVRSKSYRKLYQDLRLINDLDIVNELDGHSGCVNALSWSKSGNLLASGSDDQHLNIHSYQPSTSNDQFQLAATVATGHTQNIFSVKFMPHSNDRTVITAAGDCEVRIFDLEYAGQARGASAASTIAAESRRRGRTTLYNGVRYLSDGDTNCRVYRSHGDRVKRIVTESSPHLFLTCSEDGEVRQWDLRQPSSAYPRPSNRRSISSDHGVPPPLISYKRYNLDLNSISCSASQPHYIVLGGAHLHAFLHDRRMTGRDRLAEAGRRLSRVNSLSTEEQESLSQATQCVRKFAPKGQERMKRSDTGHITACKISDARPDEVVVSWSGDHIYSFDLIRDSSYDKGRASDHSDSKRAKESRDRKRKRQVNGSENSLPAAANVSSRPRTTNTATAGRRALRIRFGNGQSEDVPIVESTDPRLPLTEAQEEAQVIARAIRRIRQALFTQKQDESATIDNAFTPALGHAASIMSDIDEKMRSWGYPMNPTAEQVSYQQGLRKVRERTRRFVQAAGTLCRVLGGRLQTPGGPSPLMAHFGSIERRSNDLSMSSHEASRYEFLKAILLWLDSGIGSLVEGFTLPDDIEPSSRLASRLPIPAAEAGFESVDDYLIPYLLQDSSSKPVIDFDTNRFEVDANREVFHTETAAVTAFAEAVKIPFRDLSSTHSFSDDSANTQPQDRQTAQEYWALKVARGVLHNAAEGLSFVEVDRAFGGMGLPEHVGLADELADDVVGNEEEMEQTVRDVEMIDSAGNAVEGANAEDLIMSAQESRHRAAMEDNGPQVEEISEPPIESVVFLEEDQPSHATVGVFEDETEDDENTEDENELQDDNDDDDDDDSDDEEEEEEEEEDLDMEDYDDDDDDSEPDEEDGVPNLDASRFLYRSAWDRSRQRPKVELDTPAAGPTRMYRGHCNVRTVKDVNYFGPDDEYVVSGSDDGNFFIWDRKTAELVNVLEGDGEVVNVIQGHPYEHMLAVSGIDHTIKIFSPDARAREAARLGRGVSAHDASSFSSIAWPQRVRTRPTRFSENHTTSSTTSEPAVEDAIMGSDDCEDYVAPNGLKSRKRMQDAHRIIQNNNMEREGGNHETMITLPRAQLLQMLFGQLGNIGILPAFE